MQIGHFRSPSIPFVSLPSTREMLEKGLRNLHVTSRRWGFVACYEYESSRISGNDVIGRKRKKNGSASSSSCQRRERLWLFNRERSRRCWFHFSPSFKETYCVCFARNQTREQPGINYSQSRTLHTLPFLTVSE